MDRKPNDDLTSQIREQLVRLDAVESARLAAEESQYETSQSIRQFIPDYRLIRPIGEGSFGTVWLGKNVHDQTHCAIKVIKENPKVELHGIREYQQRVGHHDRLIPIQHIGSVDRQLYYVMPLADNSKKVNAFDGPENYEPLTLRRFILGHGAISPKSIISIGRDLLDGLVHMHSNGCVHRDIKPENIISVNGQWVIGDPGLACSSEENISPAGTEGFRPTDGSSNPSVDCFALGRTLRLALDGIGSSSDDVVHSSKGLAERRLRRVIKKSMCQ